MTSKPLSQNTPTGSLLPKIWLNDLFPYESDAPLQLRAATQTPVDLANLALKQMPLIDALKGIRYYQHPTTNLGSDVDSLISMSGVLSHEVSQLLRGQHPWVFKYMSGPESSTHRDSRIIQISANKEGYPLKVVNTVAHEAGHALYKDVPYVNIYDGDRLRSRNEYANKNQAAESQDEGAAVLNNIKVKHDLHRNAGIDIYATGSPESDAPYESIADRYLRAYRYSPADRYSLSQAIPDLGKLYSRLPPSSEGAKSGEDYVRYFRRWFYTTGYNNELKSLNPSYRPHITPEALLSPKFAGLLGAGQQNREARPYNLSGSNHTSDLMSIISGGISLIRALL